MKIPPVFLEYRNAMDMMIALEWSLAAELSSIKFSNFSEGRMARGLHLGDIGMKMSDHAPRERWSNARVKTRRRTYHPHIRRHRN